MMLPAEEDGPAPSYSPDALQAYLPEDGVAVFNLDVKRLCAASAFQKGFHNVLQQILRKDELGLGWLPQAGIDPWRDLEEARILISSRALFDPLFLLHGHFDLSRFQTGPGKLTQQTVTSNVGRFTYYEHPDRRRGEVVKLALVGDYLVVCDAQAPVLAALRQAVMASPTAPLDSPFRDLLSKVDRQQPLWFAVSMEKLRPVPRLDSMALELILRPIFQYADGIWGGLKLGEEVRAEVHFQTRNETTARTLEELLRSSCDAAQGVHLLPGVDRELLPLFRLVGSGVVSREGTIVRLTCRLEE